MSSLKAVEGSYATEIRRALQHIQTRHPNLDLGNTERMQADLLEFKRLQKVLKNKKMNTLWGAAERRKDHLERWIAHTLLHWLNKGVDKELIESLAGILK